MTDPWLTFVSEGAPKPAAPGLLHAARVHDARREHLARAGRLHDALEAARAAATAWEGLTASGPDRFHRDRQRALIRLGEVLKAVGRAEEAKGVRREGVRNALDAPCTPAAPRPPWQRLWRAVAPRLRNHAVSGVQRAKP